MSDPIGLRHTNFVHCCAPVIGNGQHGLMISLQPTEGIACLSGS